MPFLAIRGAAFERRKRTKSLGLPHREAGVFHSIYVFSFQFLWYFPRVYVTLHPWKYLSLSSATAKFWRMKHPIKFPRLAPRVFLCPNASVKHAHKGTKTARYHQNFFKVSSFLTLIAVFCVISPRFLLKISPSYFLLHPLKLHNVAKKYQILNASRGTR